MTPPMVTPINAPAAEPPTLAALLAPIAEPLARAERRLQDELRSRRPAVDAVVRHGYRLGGKRLRPALVLLSGQAAGRLTEHHTTLAVVVEMIHTATLVHDDVLDEAALRRHEDTVNARWGNETSVLLGDFLFSHAFYLAGATGSAEACQVIGRATNIVCEGEMCQTLSAGDLHVTEADYLAMIDAKTAELCACCCRLGALHAGAHSDTVERLADFGRNLGVAFQIADDLLDLLEDESATGKTAGADLAKRKLTLPLIHLRDTLVNGPRLTLLERLSRGDRDDILDIRRELESHGSVEYARRRAQEYAASACRSLEGLPASPATQALADLARFSVARRS